MQERLFINASLSSSFKRKTLNGRRYLVVPTTLIVPGVLPGNRGPILYTNEENAKSVDAWNNMPLLDGHPASGGENQSGRSPEIIQSQGIGYLFNVKNSGKLKGEAWFDEELLRSGKTKNSKAILERILNGQPIGVSTGLGMDRLPGKGEFKGVPYNGKAANYRPDHLAILLNEEGACSLDDGCGANVDNSSGIVMTEKKLFEKFKRWWNREGNTALLTTNSKEEETMSLSDKQRSEMVDNIIGSDCGCYTENEREVLEGMDDQRLSEVANHFKESVENKLFVTNAKKDKGELEVKNFSLGKVAKRKMLNEMDEEEFEEEYKNRQAKKAAAQNAEMPPQFAKKKEGDEEEEDEEAMNKGKTKNAKQLTEADLPQEMREDILYARNMKAKERQRIIEKLVSNVGVDEQDEEREILNKKSLEALQEKERDFDRYVSNAKKDESDQWAFQRREPDYSGMAAGSSRVDNAREPSREERRAAAVGIPVYEPRPLNEANGARR